MDGLEPVTVEHYKAGMVLSGAGDALGYRGGTWEFNYVGPNIHQELQELGGLKKITVQLPGWPVSDDTVLHLATAEALITGKTEEQLLDEVAFCYVKGMKDMSGRAPGNTTAFNVDRLKPGQKGGCRVPYNSRGAGCGAAMRAMCIGLRYPNPGQLPSLVFVAVETGRMTHHHPIGFLGSVASALFASYAIQRRPLESWGVGLLEEACPIAKKVITDSGFAVEENLKDWDSFSKHWKRYLDLRGISDGKGPVTWPDPYGVAERDKAYTSFSLSGWGGSCGHDAPMIALDALLGAGSDWEELMNRAAFHGGDNDSTAVIACCCWGLLYGTKGVPKCNYSKLEYRDRLEHCAKKLYALSH
ncbi:protein ADP-ribosylarginine hydrolase-like isoform X1 [Poecilia formosa]|uniref:protein ADP-ribosylarginine hydrolase-like isoform X1 n=1 Tax=Poecilia formosa TaxID=48698 RepID=UPI000443BADC|nr:PREDICTED: protein ADP-ribosylarginine hydrolase-like isoform X1 [Poecilia formosa]